MSSTARRLINNFFSNLISQAIILALSAFFIVYLTRILGPSEYGKYILAVNLPLIFFLVCDFFRDIVVRDVAKNNEKASAYLSNSIMLTCCISIILFIAMFIYVIFFDYSLDIRVAIYILAIYYFIQRLAVPFDSILTAFEKLWFPAVCGVFEKGIIVILSLYIISRGGGLIQFLWAFAIGGFIRLLALTLFAKRYIHIEFKINISLWKYIFRTGYPILVSTLFVTLISKIGIVFLAKLKGDEAVGLFGVGYGLYNVVTIVATSLTGSLFPLLSRYYKTQPGKFYFLFKTSFIILFIIGLLITLGAYIFSERILIIFFGKNYLRAIEPLKLIFLSLPLFFTRNLLAAVLLAADMQKATMWILGLGLLTNVILNILLIPDMSYSGVSLSFVGSEVVVFGFLSWLTYDSIKR